MFNKQHKNILFVQCGNAKSDLNLIFTENHDFNGLKFDVWQPLFISIGMRYIFLVRGLLSLLDI